MNFLQAHYNQQRDAGASHAEYCVVNELEDDIADKLLCNYKPKRKAPIVGRLTRTKLHAYRRGFASAWAKLHGRTR